MIHKIGDGNAAVWFSGDSSSVADTGSSLLVLVSWTQNSKNGRNLDGKFCEREKNVDGNRNECADHSLVLNFTSRTRDHAPIT